jgi:uncharacterized protein YlxW (UPF0749 family)
VNETTARVWRLLVPAVCLVAGVGFAASARDSGGTDLRPPGIGSLADAVRAAEQRVKNADAQVNALQAQVNRAETAAGQGNSNVAAAQARMRPLVVPAGLAAAAGPGLEVVLDDASSAPTGVSVDANELLVHQSDLRAVVNALWAGGAEAMSIAGQRVIATTTIRCAGPTLLLNGEVFSPPFRVAAIGPARTMQDRLASSPGVALFREAAEYYGLGYTVETSSDLHVPAYRGPVTLSYAKAGR